MDILIVDDSVVLRKILERSLRQTQIAIDNVLEAGDGQEALEKLHAHAVQMVFSDVNMPNMDGLELLRQIKATQSLRHVLVVIVTTDGSESTVLQALSLGAAAYIRRPFTALQMEAALANVLAENPQAKE